MKSITKEEFLAGTEFRLMNDPTKNTYRLAAGSGNSPYLQEISASGYSVNHIANVPEITSNGFTCYTYVLLKKVKQKVLFRNCLIIN